MYLFFFLGAAYLIYTIVPMKYKWSVLLIFSYGYYFINSGKYIIFLLATTVSVYFAGLFLNKIDDGFSLVKKNIPREEKKKYKAVMEWQKNAVVVITVLFNFGILVLLKYNEFISGQFNRLFDLCHIPVNLPMKHFILPLGISFYTLQAVSYIIDVKRGKYRATDNIFKVALFLSFFPQITEGPIGRFDRLADQLYEGHRFSYENLTMGIQLILWGMFKKVVIADRAGMYVSEVFENYAGYDGLIVIAAVLLYTVQIYMEFSGCMDIVAGSAQIFGITLDRNFERPFFARSVSEFWRRWHMTLGGWFRDYVFYSVSLSKRFQGFSKKVRENLSPFLGSLVPAAAAMFVVWFGTGIWHGASWKYVAYGLYYYVIMVCGMLLEPVFAKTCGKLHINREAYLYKAFQLVRTFVLVNIGMLMFNAKDLKAFAHMLVSCFKNLSFGVVNSGAIFKIGCDRHDFLIIALGVLIVLIVSILQEKGHSIRTELAGKNIVFRWAVYYALLFSVIIFGAYGDNYDTAGFIYAQF